MNNADKARARAQSVARLRKQAKKNKREGIEAPITVRKIKKKAR